MTVLAFGFAGMAVLTLTRRLLFFPLADGVRVTHNDFVHPGEGLRKQHGTLEETQVPAVQCQGEDDVFFFFCECARNGEQGIMDERIISRVHQQQRHIYIMNEMDTAFLLIVFLQSVVSMEFSHDVVVDLHEGCGSVESTQICINHFSGAEPEQCAPVKRKENNLFDCGRTTSWRTRFVFSYHSEGG